VLTAETGGIEPALAAVKGVLQAVDDACSRFRADSELSLINSSGGQVKRISPLLVEALAAAIWAAQQTDGAVDPTLGAALRQAGYDRDFAELGQAEGPPPGQPRAAPGWRLVELDVERSEVRVAAGVELDLGATAKALAADRAAASANAAAGCGVLVSLGGDIAVAGPAPDGGWPVLVTDDHSAPLDGPGQTIHLAGGGLATSSTTVRRWRRGGVQLHHILDPRTGAPANSCWRTASVAAGTCLAANTFATAAIVWSEAAPAHLARTGVAARLTRLDGTTVKLGGWPEAGERRVTQP